MYQDKLKTTTTNALESGSTTVSSLYPSDSGNLLLVGAFPIGILVLMSLTKEGIATTAFHKELNLPLRNPLCCQNHIYTCHIRTGLTHLCGF